MSFAILILIIEHNNKKYNRIYVISILTRMQECNINDELELPIVKLEN